MQFHDRREAGRVLADRLSEYSNRSDVVVLGLPRGGVPVAFEVAQSLGAPLDVLVVRKLGLPGHEELAMGAVARGGVRIINHELVQHLGVPTSVIETVVRAETNELERREQTYRESTTAPQLRNRTVIIVDDGLATGASMRAAIDAVRRQSPRKIVVAVPVAAESTHDELSAEVDDVVCVLTPEPFISVGHWYETFDQTSDDEVRRYLAAAARTQRLVPSVESSHAPPSQNDFSEYDIRVLINGVSLAGSLVVPEHATGVVLFAHGSGSSRFSPRNQYVARRLNEAGIATLLIDMLTAAEEKIDARTARLRFDIHLLAERLFHTTDWIRRHRRISELPIGYFGASTGAAAALVAAAQRTDVTAIVSRGGRPDLAGDALRQVQSAVLLLVGGADIEVLQLNREAHRQLLHTRHSELQIVPGATHLFEEPGALEDVADRAVQWFADHLAEVADAHRG